MRHFKSFAFLSALAAASSFTAFACSDNRDTSLATSNADSTPAPAKLCNVKWTDSAQSETSVETGAALVSADFNADGIQDVLILEGTKIQELQGTRNGDLHQIPASPFGFKDLEGVLGGTQMLVRDQVQVADLDGDKTLDIVAEIMPQKDSTTASLIVSYGKGDGGFSAFAVAARIDGKQSILPPTDFDGDKKLDLLVRSKDATTIVYGKDGGFEDPVKTNIPGLGDGEPMGRIGDLDSDGKPDLLAPTSTDTSTTATVYRNGAARNPFVAATITFQKALDFATSDTSLIDLNGDKIADVLAGGKGIARILSAPTPAPAAGDGTGNENTADGGTDPDAGAALIAPSVATYGTPSELLDGKGNLQELDISSFATIADFDGDKRPDAFLFMGSDQQIACGLDGDTFAPTVLAGPKMPSGLVQRIFGDFDADGRTDLIALSEATSGTTLTVLFTHDATAADPTPASDGDDDSTADAGKSNSSKKPSSSSSSTGGSAQPNTSYEASGSSSSSGADNAAPASHSSAASGGCSSTGGAPTRGGIMLTLAGIAFVLFATRRRGSRAL